MKNRSPHSALGSSCALLPIIFTLWLIGGCSPVKRPMGPARAYEDAKEMFGRGRFDRAAEFADELAKASPPNAFTERARVLRAVIFSGQVNANKELADAYAKGFEITKNPHAKAEFGRLRHDHLQYGSKLALGLGEVAHQLAQGGTIPKELTLEAPYPSAEGPVMLTQLNRVLEGGSIEPEDQEAAAVDAQRKAIDDALAKVVNGDRSKARAALMAGPVKLDGVAFALFLDRQLMNGASFFDRKHMHDPQKFKVLCGEADGVAKAALALLKTNPDPEKEKNVKKLQDEIKTAMKNA